MYLDAVRVTPLLKEITNRSVVVEWATTRLVYADPANSTGNENADILLFTRLLESVGRVERSLDIVSPYFIPGEGGTAALVALAERGVKVRILTNSRAFAEAAAVHAGYAKRREALLGAGIALFEIQPTEVSRAWRDKVPGPGVGTGLHAKTYAADRSKIFVGSFNFDQRSAHLNTEMGLVIDSPSLAGRLAEAFDTTIPQRAWRVRLARDGGGLEWVERMASGEVVYATEPGTTWWDRSRTEFMSHMPIEWLL